MTGIVWRLRKQAEDNLDPGNALVREAADEIERLTDALTKIRSVVGTSTEAWLIANRALEPRIGLKYWPDEGYP